jgi:hypothetical protein
VILVGAAAALCFATPVHLRRETAREPATTARIDAHLTNSPRMRR